MVEGTNLGSYMFVQFGFKLGNLTTHLKALFPQGLTDFPQLVHVKSEKNIQRPIIINS